MRTTNDRLIAILRAHYFFEDHELDDYSNKKVKELDVDSIGMLELFLIIENGFNLNKKISDSLDMKEVGEKTVSEFINLLASEVDKILGR